MPPATIRICGEGGMSGILALRRREVMTIDDKFHDPTHPICSLAPRRRRTHYALIQLFLITLLVALACSAEKALAVEHRVAPRTLGLYVLSDAAIVLFVAHFLNRCRTLLLVAEHQRPLGAILLTGGVLLLAYLAWFLRLYLGWTNV